MITNFIEAFNIGLWTWRHCALRWHLMMTKTGGGVTKFNPALSSDSCYTLHLPTEVDIQWFMSSHGTYISSTTNQLAPQQDTLLVFTSFSIIWNSKKNPWNHKRFFSGKLRFWLESSWTSIFGEKKNSWKLPVCIMVHRHCLVLLELMVWGPTILNSWIIWLIFDRKILIK